MADQQMFFFHSLVVIANDSHSVTLW